MRGWRRMAMLGGGAALLAACGGGPSTPPSPLEAGRKLYANNCIACHGEQGAGLPPLHPPLTGSAIVAGDPRQLARWVLLGERPANQPLPPNSIPMPQFGWLRDADAANLLTYVRATFGGNAPAVTADQVAAARQP